MVRLTQLSRIHRLLFQSNMIRSNSMGIKKTHSERILSSKKTSEKTKKNYLIKTGSICSLFFSSCLFSCFIAPAMHFQTSLLFFMVFFRVCLQPSSFLYFIAFIVHSLFVAARTFQNRKANPRKKPRENHENASIKIRIQKDFIVLKIISKWSR